MKGRGREDAPLLIYTCATEGGGIVTPQSMRAHGITRVFGDLCPKNRTWICSTIIAGRRLSRRSSSRLVLFPTARCRDLILTPIFPVLSLHCMVIDEVPGERGRAGRCVSARWEGLLFPLERVCCSFGLFFGRWLAECPLLLWLLLLLMLLLSLLLFAYVVAIRRGALLEQGSAAYFEGPH